MAKKMKKFMSMMLVLCMMASMLSVGAFAADGTVVENESTTVDGVTTDVTTTITTTTDENGNVTVNLKIESTTAGTDSEGVTINGQETYEQTTVTDANGKQIASDYVLDGSETKEWVEEDSGDTAGQPVVEAPVVPGETTVATGGVTSETVTNADGSVTTTTTTDRTVTTTTTKAEVTVNETDTGIVGDSETGLIGPAPVYDETDDVVRGSNGKIKDANGKDGVFDRNYLSGSNMDPSKWTDIPPEGEYRYIGTGEHSKYFVGLVKVIYQKDEEGNTVYDENGNPVIEKLVNNVSGDDHTSNGEVLDEIVAEYEVDGGFSGSRAQNFMLMDKEGNRVFAYCSDAQTGAVNGKWYSVSNLEDSDYYTPEAEGHIRSIALNGYWGTSDIAKEDGSYEMGSLENIKAQMIEAINNGEIERYVLVPVRDTSTEGAGKIQVDENGDPIYYEEKMDLLEVLSGMTAGEALLATQAAIWSFANGSQGATSGIDGAVVITPDWYRNHQIGYSKNEGEHLDDAAGIRVAAMYEWLMNLEETEQKTVVINEKNFVKDVSLSIGDKVSDAKENQDDNKDNDVYNSDLNFKLAFIPGEKDDLLVQITYTDLDGNDVTVIKRLAGENAEGQSYEDIKPEADGSYVLKGLKLSENKDFAFDLRLEGAQYLEDGVYLYQAVGGRDISQTFVGVAQGSRNVDVSIGVTVKFDVDENNNVVAERTWHDEADPEEAPVPFNFGHVVPRPLDNIPDEEVPLADAPQTGDEAAVFAILTVLAGISLMAMHVSEQKRKEEA
ncbi:MAG: Cys-Gln thioester bond-forming surface protein [Oscillospiraceae bacterium]|nr:Cys-Gln thioester bond-forming surface protein [Oscillospiraceae bacterium]